MEITFAIPADDEIEDNKYAYCTVCGGLIFKVGPDLCSDCRKDLEDENIYFGVQELGIDLEDE